MELKQFVLLALQLSILATVFGFGLKTRLDDLLYLVRRPGLLTRSILSVFVIMPIVAVALTQLFNFPSTVEIALIALAISPVPPLLPKKETKSGGHASFALGLMAILAVLSIVAVPLALELLERFFGRQFGIAPGTVARAVLKSAIAPLAVGMGIRALLPTVARRLEKPSGLIAKVLMPPALLALILAALPELWARIGDGSLLAIAIFTVAGVAIGQAFGRPDHDHSIVLALSTACRHPAIALTILTANFPDRRFGAIILLYLIVNALVLVPYLSRTRQVPGAVRRPRAA